MTNDFFRRWRQHIGDLKGGAKYTKKKKDWYPICIVDGFETMKVRIWILNSEKSKPRLSEFQNPSKHNYKYHDWLTRGTQN